MWERDVVVMREVFLPYYWIFSCPLVLPKLRKTEGGNVIGLWYPREWVGWWFLSLGNRGEVVFSLSCTMRTVGTASRLLILRRWLVGDGDVWWGYMCTAEWIGGVLRTHRESRDDATGLRILFLLASFPFPHWGFPRDWLLHRKICLLKGPESQSNALMWFVCWKSHATRRYHLRAIVWRDLTSKNSVVRAGFWDW